MQLPEEASEFDAGVVKGGLYDDEVAWLNRQRECRALMVGSAEAEDLVKFHHVPFLRHRWSAYERWLPESTATEGRISRADVFQVSEQCRKSGDWLRLLVASFVWGQGDDARGPVRLGWILDGKQGRACPPLDEIERRLGESVDTLHQKGPVLAYQQLGGSGKVPNLGAAFFTKFLYFASRVGDPTCRAMILDARLAGRMRWFWQRRFDRSHAPGTREPEWLWRGPAWSSHRYHVYLAFLSAAAAQLSESGERWTPELVELLLFRHDPGADLGPAVSRI